MNSDHDDPRDGARALFRVTLMLAAGSGAALGVLESGLWLVHEVVLKSFYVQDRLGVFTVLRELVDTGVLARAAVLYGVLATLAAIPVGALAIVGARRGTGGREAGHLARALAVLGSAAVLLAIELTLVRRGSVGALWPVDAVGLTDGVVVALLAAVVVLAHGRLVRALDRLFSERVRRGLRRVCAGAGALLAAVVLLGLLNGAVSASGQVRRVPQASASQGRPSVLFVVLDTARADRFSSYGNERPTSPAFDRLAARGVLYEHAWSSAPWTLPSHASLFTGELPHRHGAHWGPLQLDPDLPTLAERFREAGYRTAAFTNNPWIGSVSGLDRGFDELYELWREHGGSWDRLLAVRALRRMSGRAHDEGAAATSEQVRRWLKNSGEQPSFIFVNLMEVHDPNWPAPEAERFLPPGTTRERLRALNQNPYAWFARQVEMSPSDFELLTDLYDAQLAYVDRWLGRIVADFEAARPAGRNIIVVVGDHGENLGDHGAMSHVFSVGEPLLHVPLVLVADGVDGGRRVATPVSTMDLAPTLERLAGLAPAGAPGRAGRDLLAQAEPRARPLVAENYTPVSMLDLLLRIRPDLDLRPFDRSYVAVREGSLKLVSASDGSLSLYDLDVDPGELENLAMARPEETARLLAAARVSLEAVHGARDEEATSSGRVIDELTRERLEGLGYALPPEPGMKHERAEME